MRQIHIIKINVKKDLISLAYIRYLNLDIHEYLNEIR